ncbi:hypothetical protein MYOV003v1_p0102 [Vibrio phage 207E48.1]|nr:hypothetical protein MYOV003v1_p0102 [Vibrio phage 207E48.1]
MKYSKIACYGTFARKPKKPFTPPVVEGRPQCFYMKGTNGSGKSTIASELRARDPDAYYVCIMGRKLLTVFPNFNTLAVGKYDNSNSKGCDSLKDTEEMLWAVTVAEQPEFSGMHMIFDGIIPASILGTWVERLRERDRELVVAFLSTPFETCLERIRARNKGKVLDDDLIALVKRKYDRIVSFRERHTDLFPETQAVIINAETTIEQMLVAFLNRNFGEI